MTSNAPTNHPDLAAASGLRNRDEAELIALLEGAERKHGFIPREMSEEVNRLVEVRLERLRRIQGKLDSGIKRDVQMHVAHWRDEEGNLIMILHAIQNQYGFVPREVAMELSRELGVKLARIYEVITFYHYFKLQARARLGVAEGETTADRQFHLDVVRCIGCCGMSPALVIDGRTHGRVKTSDIAGLIETAKKTEAVR